MKMFKKNNKGFTLVELLVVIAIIAILAAVIAPNAFKAIEKSKVSAVISDYRAVKVATLVYYSDVGKWPLPNAGEVGFVKVPNAVGHTADDGWNGPYLDVWTGESPLGGNYTFVEGTKDSKDYVGIKLTDISQSAFDRIKTALGAELINGDKDPVDLIIAITE